ncbi:VOC family protein [Arthrobacter sp. JSM 101049]|uniref:VOC family protein n=1 Tax=Arthrobacter sp. JSM 101049 TaxID=929097 RepID=UPI00356520AE
MPVPDLRPGSPCWIDLMTSKPERARSFYATLFGWTYEAGDQETYGGYVLASKDGHLVAGLMENDGEAGTPDGWSTYLRVEDVDATVATATAHGGKVLLPPMDIPAQGRMAMLLDPAGAAVGAWESGAHTGFGVHGDTGAPAWHELHARCYPDTVEFYRKVFGWEAATMSDTDEFRYTTDRSGRTASAGILDATAFLHAGYPAAWQVYFQVEDAEAAITQALGLGASVVDAPRDSPFGRVASLSDPTGASFKIIEPPQHG